MLKLNFTLNLAKKSKEIYKRLINKNIEAIVIKDNNDYFVVFDNKKYPLTEESYNSKGKIHVWSRNKTKYGFYHIIRLRVEDRKSLPTNCYIPFKENVKVKGDIIKIQGTLYFRFNDVILEHKIVEDYEDS